MVAVQIMQDRYLVRHFDPIPDKLNGSNWVIIMIDTTWRSVRTLWDLRNGCAQKQKEQAHRELRALYILRRDMRHCDRDVFYPTVDEHLDAQPVWALKNWLRVYKPMVKHSIKEAIRASVLNVRTIASYFIPPTHPNEHTD